MSTVVYEMLQDARPELHDKLIQDFLDGVDVKVAIIRQ